MSSQKNHQQQFDATLALHAGEGERALGQPVNQPPMFSTSFYTHPDAAGFSANDLKAETPPFYTRWGNPTLELLENRLAALEQGEAAVTFSSGMAAISALFMQTLQAGDHLVISDVCYAGTAELAHDTLTRYGIQVTAVDTSDLEAVSAAMQPNTRLVHIETPANPILKLTDISEVAQIVHAAGAELAVDSTISTPIGTKPLTLGADYVLHSLTKYLCGHGDVLGGAVIGSAERMATLRRQSLIHIGGVLAPFSAWLILRGIETLTLRMQMHEQNTRVVEHYLASHPSVKATFWPGSENHPQHTLALKQMRNFSGLMSFTLKEKSHQIARRLSERLKVFSYAVSLGKTKSLLHYIPTSEILRTSFHLDEKQAQKYRDWAGEGVFRVSVGLEEASDLIQDLEQALLDSESK